MPTPTLNDVRPVNPVLTDLSIGFKNERFLWDKIAPPAEKPEKSATYFTYTRDYWFRRLSGALRASSGPYTRADYGLSTATYNALERGFEKVIPDPDRAASQTPESLDAMATRFLTNLIQLELEKDVAAAAFITGVWGTSTTLAGTDQWSDFDASDPIDKIEVAKRTIRRNTGAKPNTLFLGALAWEKLKEHPLILDKYKHTMKGIMTPELVAAALELAEVVVGDSVENTAAEGAAFAGADIWTDNALLVVRNDPAIDVAAGAFTFVWNEKNNVPWAVEDYRDENLRADVIRVFTHYDIKIVSAQHGYMFLDCVA